MQENATLTITAPGVLGNDTDIDSSPASLVVASHSTPSGTLVLNADGSFSYTPPANFSGTVTFTYFVSDGQATSASPATVTITVNDVNSPPDAVNDAYATNEDTPLVKSTRAEGVLGNDTDPDLDSLTATLVTAPAHASAFTLGSDGTFSYTPAANYFGPDSFTYAAHDGHGGSDTATVSITINPVNDAPVAVDDAESTVSGGTIIRTFVDGVLANDSDVDNLKTTLAVSHIVMSGPLHAAMFNLASDGGFTYTHDGGVSTTDSFTYTVCDPQSLCDTATVTINIDQGSGTVDVNTALQPYRVEDNENGEFDLWAVDPAAVSSPGQLLDADIPMTEDRDGAFHLIETGTYDGPNRRILDAQYGFITYVKDGRVYRVDLRAGMSRTPVQVSNLSNACEIEAAYPDLFDSLDSILAVQTAGDGCSVPGPVELIELGAGGLTDPIATLPAGYDHTPKALMNYATGAIEGFLALDMSGCAGANEVGFTATLVRTNRNLTVQTDDLTTFDCTQFVDVGNGDNIYSLDDYTEEILFVAPQPVIYFTRSYGGAPTYALVRYSRALDAVETIDVALPGVSDGFLPAAYDETHFFYGDDSSRIKRVAHSSTSSGDIYTESGGAYLEEFVVTADRLVFERADGSSDGPTLTLSSIPKVGGSRIDYQLPAGVNVDEITTNASRIYVDGEKDDGTHYALIYDGIDNSSNQPSISGMQDADFVAFVNGTTYDAESEFHQAGRGHVVRAREDSGIGMVVFETLDAETGAVVRSLGAIDNLVEQVAYGDSPGAQLLLQVLADRGGSSDSDIYFVNTNVASSLLPISVEPGVNELLFEDEDEGDDSDGDGLTDDDEVNLYDTDPGNPDTDGDGLQDGTEVNTYSTDPNEFDSDGDFLGDGEEISLGTDPNDPDMDGDSVGDGIEIRAGSDPDTANLTYHVGTDTCDDASPGSGLTWADAFCTNAALEAQLEETTGSFSVEQPVFVLYDEDSSPGPLTLNGNTMPSYINLVGSLDGDAGDDYKPGNPTDHADTSYTRFDGGGSERALNVVNMDNVYLQSLELVNGQANRGAGLYLSGSNGAGWDLVIRDNAASVAGGGLGLGLLPSSFTLYGSEIVGNTAVNGGGFHVGPDQDLVLSSTYVADNEVVGMSGDVSTGNGGGGMVEGSFVADGVIFANNSVDLVSGVGGNGGGLFIQRGGSQPSSVDVRQSQFLSNSAATGGGISYIATTGDTVQIRNSLFVGNLADSGVNGDSISSGGALHILDADAVAVLSNTFAYNEAVSAAGSAISGGVRYDPQGGTSGLFSHNIFWFNIETAPSPSGTPNFVEGVAGSTLFDSNNNQDGISITGGISANPTFIHGFYLDQVSNASVNGGTGDSLGEPFTTNIDGTPDSDALDLGFHYVGPSTGLVDAVEAFANYSSESGPVPVEFKPVHNEQLVGPGRLIGVCLLNTGSSSGLVLESITNINPVGSIPSGCRAAPVLAIDHGDGTYQVNVTGSMPGTIKLQVFDNALAVPGGTIEASISHQAG